MTNSTATATATAELIAPLGVSTSCPLPYSVNQGEPVFITEGAMRALSVDVYFLTLHRPSDDQNNPEGTWQDEWKVTLKIERKSQPAFGRIVQWLEENLSGWTLHEWEYDDPTRPYNGVVGLMTMRSVA